MIEATLLLVIGVLGLVWVWHDIQDLERSESEHRRKQEAFNRRIAELLDKPKEKQ